MIYNLKRVKENYLFIQLNSSMKGQKKKNSVCLFTLCGIKRLWSSFQE